MEVRPVLRSVVESVVMQLPRRTAMGDRLVLSYHNIVPAGERKMGDQSLHLSVDEFDAQLRMLAQEADVVPLQELLNSSAQTTRLAAVTFDDAYRSALEFGVQACGVHRMPCTVFVAPALLGRVPPWDLLAERGHWSSVKRHQFLWEEHGIGRTEQDESELNCQLSRLLRIATADELRHVIDVAGVSIGNHTMNHVNLGSLSPAEAKDELLTAHSWLRQHVPNVLLPIVAYPYGIRPKDCATVLAAARLTHGFAVDGGWYKTKSFAPATRLPRWNVPAGISRKGFQLRLRGWFSGT